MLMHIFLAEVTKENQVLKVSKWGQRDVQHLKEILSRHQDRLRKEVAEPLRWLETGHAGD